MASALTSLSRRLRTLFPSCSPTELENYLSEIDEFAANLTEDDPTFHAFENELHSIHDQLVVDTSQTEIFVAILHRLIHVLPSTSLIASWWDLCLRPALRDPKLSVTTVQRVRELVLAALHNPSTQYTDLVAKFRQQLMVLYLLDAFNEGSGEDMLAWAEKDHKERTRLTGWKFNLETILVRHGCEHPTDFLDEINDHFLSEPGRRLQLLMLLDTYVSGPFFPSASVPLIAAHPIMMSLLTSLQLDGSSTACIIGLTVVLKLMPNFAIKAIDSLKKMLPRMLAILARVICWKGRTPVVDSDLGESLDGDLSTGEPLRSYPIREDLFWKPLELTFNTNTSSTPSAKHYFTLLYFLFPCNTIRFLRQPVQYLASHNVPSPYGIGWSDVLDDDHIRSRSEAILRSHVIHPHIIWGDADAELADSKCWADYDVSRIIGESTLLDVRNAGVSSQQYRTPISNNETPLSESSPHGEEATAAVTTPRIFATELPPSPSRRRVSLQEILTTSVMLKSGREIDMSYERHLPRRPLLARSASSGSTTRPMLLASPTSPHAPDAQVPPHIAHTIAELQREVLLLRNELNLELWLNRENVKHIGRLHEERVLSRSAEAERQALHNRLREYKNTVTRLQDRFASRETEADLMRSKIMEWNADIQKKYETLRSQRSQWDKQTASLRSDNVDLKAKLEAQGKLLADAKAEVFIHKTKIKETGHKIERLRDYEAQIAQLTATQRLWNEDAQKYRDQKREHEVLISNFKKMQLRLESYEQSQAVLVEQNRLAREELRELEVQFLAVKAEKPRHDFSADIAASHEKQALLLRDNDSLRKQVEALQREANELKVSLEQMNAPPGWSR